MCRPSANTENSRHTREKPLVPRVAAYLRRYQKHQRKFHLMLKNQEVDGDLFFNVPLESKDQKANSQDLFHNELIFGQFIRGKIDAS